MIFGKPKNFTNINKSIFLLCFYIRLVLNFQQFFDEITPLYLICLKFK